MWGINQPIKHGIKRKIKWEKKRGRNKAAHDKEGKKIRGVEKLLLASIQSLF